MAGVTPSTKDACVFLLDLSRSMQKQYQTPASMASADPGTTSSSSSAPTPPSTGDTGSRLSSAVEAVQVLVSSLMLRSKVHEVSVILLGTKETRNRLADSR